MQQSHKRTPIGYAYVHSAVDAYSRLAYSEVLADEKAVTAAGFWRRAVTYFATVGIQPERVLTDNGSCYRSRDFAAALGAVVRAGTGLRRAAHGGACCRCPARFGYRDAQGHPSIAPCGRSGG